MKIAIIGPGAIGRLLAWLLVRGGHQPLLICRRQEQVDAFLQNGLTCVDVDGTEHHVTVEASLNQPLSLGDALADIDAAIITVKSYDTRAAGALLTDLAVPVLSLQNGLGNGETLAERLQPKRIALGLTTHGATAVGDTTVLYKGQGQTIIGDWLPSVTQHAHWWADLLAGCGHTVTVSDSIRTEVWRKAMVNIGINPFTALLRVANGELLKRESVLPVMQAAVEEAEAVAATLGIDLQDSFTRVLEVCRQTAANRSSMLQDIEQGRITEIEALCGTIVQQGAKASIQTPTNWSLLQLIKALHP